MFHRVIGLVFVILVLSQMQDPARVNLWSVRVHNAIEGRYALVSQLPVMEIAHQRVSVWLSGAALQVGDIDLAEKWLDSGKDLEDVFAARMRGWILLSKGKESESLEAFFSLEDFISLVRIGKEAAGSGRTMLAYEAFRLAAELNPQGGTLVFASFLRDYGPENDEAIQVLLDAIRGSPDAPQRASWLKLLGQLYSEDGLWTEAEEVYLALLQITPDNTSARLALGWVYFNSGNHLELALNQFREIISRNPNSGDGYFAIGNAYYRSGNYKEAENWLVQALSKNQDNRWWRLVYANNLLKLGKTDLAIEIYVEIITKHPDWSQPYYEIAWAYFLKDDQDEAIRAIDKALSYSPAPDEWYYLRAAKIYEWAGGLEKAQSFYQQVILLNPTQSDAQDGLERLLNK